MAKAKAVSLTIDMMNVDQHLTEVTDRWLKILVRGLWGGVSCFKSLHSCHTDPVKIDGRGHVRCPLRLTIDLLFKELDHYFPVCFSSSTMFRLATTANKIRC